MVSMSMKTLHLKMLRFHKLRKTGLIPALNPLVYNMQLKKQVQLKKAG